MPARHTQSAEVRFWRQVETGDGCWTWTGNKNERGYGRFWPKRRHHVYAHRYAYEISIRPLGEGECVLHRCDNPSCVRPEHMFIGDRADNIRDASAKFRLKHGKDHHAAKLDDGRVRLIRGLRAQGALMKEIGALLGVDRKTVADVLNGKTWRHVG